MKKFLVVAALALGVAACSQQTASAWTNFNFGVGLNLGFQSGGNSFLWGAYRNGQPGGHDSDHGHHPHPAPYPMDYGMDFQFLPEAPAVATPAPTSAPTENQARWFGNPGFQTVNFAPAYYGYQGSYYVPVYGYGR